MQFHLEENERVLLANVLLEQDPRQYHEMLNKVMDRDFRFDSDQLEQAGTFLASKERSLKDQIVRESNAATKAELESQLALLEHLLERVNEACVMF